MILTRLWIAALLVSSGQLMAVVKPSHVNIKTSSQLVSETTHKKLKRVQVLIDRNDLNGAIEELSKLEKLYKNRNGDYAKISQYKGFVLAQKEDYLGAVGAFMAALDSGGLDKSAAVQSMELSGQIYMSLEKYESAAALFESVKIHKKELSPNILAATAVTYAHLKSNDEALANINKAIRNAEKVNLNWLDLKIALLFEKQQFKEATDVLKQAIEMSPEKKKYWRQLVAASMSQDKEMEALAALKSVDMLNLDVEKSDILHEVQLQMSVGEPYFAAERLAKALTSGTVTGSKQVYQYLAQAWTAARENSKAIAAYEEASKFDDSGSLDLLRAQLLLEDEKWDQAEEALNSALTRVKKDEDIGKARLLLGIAQIHRHQIRAAKSHFQFAMKMDKYESQAKAWLSFID